MEWLLVIVAVAIIGAGTASVVGSWHTRRDIATGRPSYLSLADYTGVWDRAELAEHCGQPNDEDRYTVSASEAAKVPGKLWLRLFDSVPLDLASVVAAAVSLWLVAVGNAAAVWMLTICGSYQIISWGVTAWNVVRNASWER